MKERIVDERLVQREVPAYLDARVLAAAKLASLRRQKRRRVQPWIWSVSAAAAGLMIAAGIIFQQPEAVPAVRPVPAVKPAAAATAKADLLALNDWSEFEQNGYVLMGSVGSCSQDLADWNRNFNQETL